MRLLIIGRLAISAVIIAASGPSIAFASSGQVPPPQNFANAPLEEVIPTAPVVVDGVRLFRVRGVSSMPAEERAQTIAGRIAAAASSPAVNADDIRVNEVTLGSQITAGRQLIMVVTDADAGVEGVSRAIAAESYRVRIRTAIVAYRNDRGLAAVRRQVSEGVIATVVLLVVLAAIIWSTRRLDALLEATYRRKVEALAEKSREVVSAGRLWDSLRGVIRFARLAVVVVAAFVYLNIVLGLFPQTRAFARGLAGGVVDPLAGIWWSFLAKLPDLIFLAVLIVIVRIALRMLRRFFDAVGAGRIQLANFDREWAPPTYKLVRLFVVAFALVVGYPYIPGSGSDAFKGVSLFLGVVFSLGSSSFISNMIAGQTMTYRRAFKVGDRVKIGDVTGFVTSVRLQVTHLRTIKNEEVVVPNSQILTTHVVNYSALAQTSGLILHTTVGIGYETPWRQVEAMLMEAARRTPGLMTEPAPFVRQLSLGDFCVTYQLNVYCNDPVGIEVAYTRLHRSILDVFNEYGVQIMTPAYEGDPEVAKVVPKDQWYLAPAKPELPGTPSNR